MMAGNCLLDAMNGRLRGRIAHTEGGADPERTDGDFEPGKGKTVRGWDVVTGKPLWTWYAKAQPGDPNREKTWLNGSAESNISPDIWGTTMPRSGSSVVAADN
jgi:hypothetical protein